MSTLSPDPAWQRAFIALAPNDATRDALARINIPAPLRPLLRADLHLTLAFLGGISEAQRHALARHLARLPDPIVPPLRCNGLTYWPNAERPRVLVASFDTTDALTHLLGQIHQILHTLALPVETRPFHPHITLARPGRGQPRPAPALPTSTIASAAFNALGLYARSEPGSTVRYQALWLR